MDPESWSWMIVLHEETGRPINVFVLASSSKAVAYNHRSKGWTVNPELVTRTSWENQREGLDRLRTTDRAGAEEAARQFGTTLPDETELRLLLVADPAD